MRRAAIGAFALVATPYAFKFLWSPLIDWLPPPLPLGRRRGWGIHDPDCADRFAARLGFVRSQSHLAPMAGLALLVAFLSASQDIVIDAWRIEILPLEQQGPGAGMIQTGYRLAMLVSGAGALIVAALRLVRGLCHDGCAAERDDARIPVRPRTVRPPLALAGIDSEPRLGCAC